MMRRSEIKRPVTYGSVGMTAAPDSISFPPPGFGARATLRKIGSGAARYQSAMDALFTWGMHSAADVDVDIVEIGDASGYHGLAQDEDGQWRQVNALLEQKFTSEGIPYLVAGTEVRTKNLWTPTKRSSEFRVIYVVNDPKVAGFAWGTLDETPVVGEEFFGVQWRDDDTVWAFVTSITQIPVMRWRFLKYPLIRLRQFVARRHFVRALSPARQA